MFKNTQIEKKLNVDKLLSIIKKYKEKDVECTFHTFFRLSEKQRKIFTCAELRRILLNEKPFLAGIQYNRNYALFYKHQNRNLKIIIGINDGKVNIVTFYFIEEWQVPKI